MNEEEKNIGERIFLPGSEWLYFKIYTGHKSADRLLGGHIRELALELESAGIVKRWFFIRYSDPDFHIRLRLRVRKTEDYGHIFGRINSYLRDEAGNGSVRKLMCDTYERELERYGRRTMELSEEFFHADSRAVLDLLRWFAEEGEPEDARWLLSLNMADDILCAFGMDLIQRRDFMKRLGDDFKREHGFITGDTVNHVYLSQLDRKYRVRRKEVERSLELRSTEKNPFREILDGRLERIRPVAERIIGIREEEGSGGETESHIRSLIHMTMNRLFRAKNRLYEMVIYDFLYRYYRSETARRDRAQNGGTDR